VPQLSLALTVVSVHILYHLSFADEQPSKANVDWALINFMRDWFPAEAKAKLLQNERDAAEDEMRALGLNPGSCIIM
jgi:hypothetical protein